MAQLCLCVGSYDLIVLSRLQPPLLLLLCALRLRKGKGGRGEGRGEGG